MDTKNVIVNFGPQHPAAHGVLRLLVELDGERVVSLDPHIGFLHRGTEKLIEHKTYKQAIPYFDRLDYVSTLSQEHGFVLATEYLLNIKPSKKKIYIRVLFDELTRLLNHIMCITTHALDVGAITPFLWGFEEREKIMYFYEQVSGARMHAAYYDIGGITSELPDSLLEEIFTFSTQFLNFINSIDDLLTDNPIWKSRLENIGIISKQNSINYGLSGPVLRGSGIPWDLRLLQPYSKYSDFKFSVPTGLKGSAFSRYLVRLTEMRESINIISQAVIKILHSENDQQQQDSSYLRYIKAKFKQLIYNRNEGKSTMESLINAFYKTTLGTCVKKGNYSCLIEAPKGESGVLLMSDGSNKPYRCKIKAPGFLHLQVLNIISQNHLLADIVTNIGSLDIVFGEIDR